MRALVRGRAPRLKTAGLVLLLAPAPGFGLALLASALLLPVLALAPAHAQTLNLVERTLAAEEQGQADDVLILRDGGVERGSLLGCAGDSCTLVGASVPRDTIAWIGLKPGAPTPPGAQDATLDEVHLRDGSVHPGRLVGISQYEVATERGSQPRDEVAWVHLAPEEQQIAGGPTPFGAPRDAPAGPEPTNPIPEPEQFPIPQAPTPAAPGAPVASGTGQRGALWIGRIESRSVVADRDGSVDRVVSLDPVRLREMVYPIQIPVAGGLRRVGTYIDLIPEGTVFTERLSFNHPGCTHAGTGTTELSRPDESASGIYKKDVEIDTTPGVGWDVPSGPGVYVLSLGARSSSMGGPTFTTSGCSDSQQWDFAPIVIGRHPGLNGPFHIDPEIRFLEAGQMTGSFNAPVDDHQVSVSWSICRVDEAYTLPILLGNLFEPEMAELSPDGAAALERLLPRLRCSGSAQIDMTVKDGSDELFLEVLAWARIDALKAWFREQGVDPASIEWKHGTGPEDGVQVKFGQ